MAQAELNTHRPSNAAVVDDQSLPFVGRWHTLISTTNWEKGRIISDWRAAKQADGHEVSEYSDEAWASLVGEVTSQHVGRLRRVHDRFGEVYREYDGLYWSHFHAALDWDDAEIWLEGAVQKRWSVSQMRRQRDIAHGQADAAEAPTAESSVADPGTGNDAQLADVVDPDAEADQSVADRSADAAEASRSEETEHPAAEKATAAPKARPFETLAELPDDLADAFEAMKLAILNHKLAGWQDVSCDDLLGALDALKQLALAPSE